MIHRPTGSPRPRPRLLPASLRVDGRHTLQLGRLISVLVMLTSVSTAALGAPAAVSTLWGSPSPVVVLAYSFLMALPVGIGACAAVSLIRGGGDSAETRMDLARRVLVAVFLTVYAMLAVVTAFRTGVPVVHHFTLASSQSLLVNFLICVTAATPLVLGVRARFVFTVAVTLTLELVALRLPDTPLHTQLLAPLMASGPALMCLGALTWLLHQAQNLDHASLRRLSQENVASQEQARILGRRHVNDFIHDHILSALIPVATGLHAGPQLTSTALQALDSLDGIRSRATPTDAAELMEVIAEDVHRLSPRVRVSSFVGTDTRVPHNVARAGIDVIHEAVVNALRHAGPGASCTVAVRWTPDGLHLEVSDDGVGFSATKIPPGRRGITHSILARMDAVGGSATLASTLGRGTRVSAQWLFPDTGSPGAPAPVAPGEVRSRGQLWLDRRRATALPWNARLFTSMDSAGARTLGIAVTATTAAAVWASRPAYSHFPPVLLAFVLCAGLGTILLWRWPTGELPAWVSLAFPLVLALSNVLVLFSIPADGWPMYEAWSLGAGANLCCAALMRERPLTAWAGILALFVTTLAWVVHGHQPLALSFTMLIGHVLTVSMWWLAAAWSAKVSTSIAIELDRHAEALSRSHVQDAVEREMDSRLTTVAKRARPVLERLAAPGEPSEALRMEARLLEAELRDEIRGASFTGTPVVRAAREARARGIDVVLLDDTGARGLVGPGSGGVTEERWEQVVDTACDALRHADTGRVTIRLLPPGRAAVATIATDSGTTVISAQRSATA